MIDAVSIAAQFGCCNVPSNWSKMTRPDRLRFAAKIRDQIEGLAKSGDQRAQRCITHLNWPTAPAEQWQVTDAGGIIAATSIKTAHPSAIRVTIPFDGIYTGGTEVWAATLAKYADPKKLAITILAEACYSRAMFDRLAEHATVIVGPGQARQVPATEDIVLRWTSSDVACSPRTVQAFMAHGCGEWTARSWRKHAVVCKHRVAVSRAASVIFMGEPCTVIPNGVDLDRLKPTKSRDQIRKDWGIREGEKVLGYVGRISPEKDPFAAARVTAVLGRPWRSVIVGPIYSGDCQVAKKRFPAVYPGEMEVANALAGFDVAIMTSPVEGASIVALETIASGVPLVSTRVGNVADIEWEHRAPCEIVPVGATDSEIAGAVMRAKQPAGLLVRSYFNGRIMAERWTTYLRSLVAVTA